MSAVLKESPMVFDMLDDAGPEQPLAELPQTTRMANARPVDLTQITPMTLLQIAVERGTTPLDVLERLMEKAAETSFTEAMAKFKEDPPIILKGKHVHFEGKDGGATTDYHHATHAAVTVPIIKGLAKVGITHMWVPEQRDGYVYVTCVLTHAAGHAKSVTMFASPDTSGNKRGVQTIVSTKTYLERHTLLSITGLTTDDMPDEDGADTITKKGVGGGGPPFDIGGDGDPLRERAQHQRSAGPPPYDAGKFAANLPAWTDVIRTGRKTADALIKHVEKTSPFTAEQQQALRSIATA